jgi:hypothetical protein
MPTTKKDDGASRTLERGDLYFFYRPKVEEEDPKSREDIQRLYMVLRPESGERHRLIIVGHKRMPKPGQTRENRLWAYVDLVRKDPKAVRQALGPEDYSTKTRGERHVPTARPAGEGVYRIVAHDGHTHLVYALELPEKPGEVQKALEIEPKMSYIINVANPERGQPRTAGLSHGRQAHYPKYLMERFRGRKFSELDPPDFLDKEGAEVVLITASEDIDKELGIELKTEHESAASAEIFKDLRLDRSKRPTEPLFEGQWE